MEIGAKRMCNYHLIVICMVILSHNHTRIFGQTIPSDLSNLKIWFKSTNVLLNAGFVQQWNDSSANNFHLTQPVSGSQPQKINNVLNGFPAIRFDGVDDNLKTLFGQNYSGLWTIFILFKNSNSSPVFIYDGGTTYSAMIYVNNSLFIQSDLTNISYPKSAPFNFTFFQNEYNTNQSKIYENGNLKLTNVLPVVNLDGFTLGSLNSQNSYFLTGDIIEIIGYNSILSNSEKLSIELYLNNKYAPPINLGSDINNTNTFCNKVLKLVNPNNNEYSNYIWNTGATTPTLSVTQSGKYWLKATNIFGRTSTDTVIAQFPNYNLPPQNKVCFGDSLLWNSQLHKSNFTFQWQDNSTDSLFKIKQAGNYYALITDKFGCSSQTPTLSINIDNFASTTSLGNNVSLCAGNKIGLTTNTISVASYTWNDGSHLPSLTINTTGQYFVAVTNTNNCIAKDTIAVTILGQAPTVNFATSVGCKNSAVTFTNLSLAPSGNSITSTFWNFGNTASPTNTSSIFNPIHLFSDTVKYVVSLVVGTDVGCSNSITYSLHVAPNPTVNFSFGMACQNDSTQFTSITSSPSYSIINKQWNFGDVVSGSSNISSANNPKHLFSNQLNYNVKFKVTNSAGCKDSIIKVIAVKAQVKADFIYTPACTNQLIKFYDNSIVPSPNNTNARYWAFGTSAASGTVANHSYPLSGTYNVTLTVIGNNGCNSKAIKQVTVTVPPTAKFFGTLNNFCLNDSILLTDASTGNFPVQQWFWSNNNTLYSNLSSVYFRTILDGSHTIKLKVIDSKGCKDSVSKTIIVYPLPMANFTITPVDVFANTNATLIPTTTNAASYNWSDANGFNSSMTQPIYVFSDTGKYIINLKITDANGCVNKQQQAVQVLTKRTDLALYELTTTMLSNGYVDIVAQLANVGTAPITQFNINAIVTNGAQVQNNWQGVLNKGSILNYHFTSAFKTENQNSILCSEITQVNDGIDDNTSNNTLCRELFDNGTTIYEPYPNPSSENILFPITVKNTKDILFEITNALGELVLQETKKPNEGLNLITLSVYGFAKGTYIAKITIGDKIFVKKIMRK